MVRKLQDSPFDDGGQHCMLDIGVICPCRGSDVRHNLEQFLLLGVIPEGCGRILCKPDFDKLLHAGGHKIWVGKWQQLQQGRWGGFEERWQEVGLRRGLASRFF